MRRADGSGSIDPLQESNRLWHRYRRFWRSDPRADLEDELAFHVQARIDDFIAAGMTPDDARAEAARRLGDLAGVRAECIAIDTDTARRRTVSEILRALAADVRVAVRQLRHHRGLTAAALACLALGIGANSAVFSVVDAVLFRPLPFRDPGRLVLVGEALPVLSDQNFGTISAPDFLDFRQLDGSTFESSAAFEPVSSTLTGGSAPELLNGLEASASLLRVLGVQPAIGRGFRAGEDAVGAPDVVILADALWRRRFGADPAIVGRAIVLDGRPVTVIGVMPRGFAFPLPGLGPEPADYFVPYRMTPDVVQSRGNSYDTDMIARLAAGVTVEQARARVNAVAAALPAKYPAVYPASAHIRILADALPLRERLVSGLRRSLLILLGAVGCVLLIACINVSSLLLARAAGRTREIAVRTALGASRARLVEQFLAESAVLAACGTVLGLIVAYAGVGALASLAPDGLLSRYAVGLDARVFAFTLGVAVIAAVGFSLVPVLHRADGTLAARLRDDGRGASSGRARQRGRRALVVSQLALALVLVAGAGLLLRSFVNARRVDPGFAPDRLLSFQLLFPSYRYPSAASVMQGEQRLITALARVPGARRVSAAVNLPMTGHWEIAMSPEGVTLPRVPLVVNDLVMPGYFETMGIQLVRGRAFDEHDAPGSPPVAIVDEEMAKRYFGGADPIGHRLKWGAPQSTDPWSTIVGVVRTVKTRSLDEGSMPETYFPALQLGDSLPLVNFALRDLRYAVRTTGDPVAIIGQVRRAVRAVDPELPVTHVIDGRQLVADGVASRRFDLLLLGAFAALALVLASVGIYGLIAYSVVQRQREIGVRLALGASPGRVVRLVLRDGAWTAAAGAALGIVGAVVLTRLMRSLLFGIGTLDGPTFVAAVVLLVGIALFASWLPARRAAGVDPVVTIRGE